MKAINLLKRITEYRGTAFESSCYITPEYEEFAVLNKKWLMYLCKEHNWELVKFYKGHFDFNAVVKDSQRHLVNILSYDMRDPHWYDKMVFRTMADLEDTHGGSNCWTSCDELEEGLLRFLI